MTNRPSWYYLAGQKVLDQITADAPPHVKATLKDLFAELQLDPYPHPGRNNVAPVKGVNVKHLYIAWKDDVHVSYRVTQDQPVIMLVGVHWFGPPRGPDDGDGGDADGGWGYSLAA